MSEPRLFELLQADVRRQRVERQQTAESITPRMLLGALGNHRFHPVLLLRLTLAAARHRRRPVRTLARILSYTNMTVYGVEVALQSRVGPGLYLPHAGGIVLGASSIGAGVTIFQGVTLGASALDLGFDEALRPTIEDGVTVAAGAKVLGGVNSVADLPSARTP